jgi:lipopolysaccharide export system permease protein
MKILQKYVLREFLGPLAYCFATFYGLYVLSTLFGSIRKLAEAHASLPSAIRYFVDYMSPYVVWLVPASLMLAALYTVWRFCHHGEIVAMRANGLSYATISTPLLSVAAVLAVCCALNQEFYAPKGRESARRVEAANFRRRPSDIREMVTYYNYAARRIWLINRMDLDRPNTLEGVRITIERPDGHKAVDIACTRAEYLDGVWWLRYPQYRYFDASGNPAPTPPNPLLNLTVRPMPHFTETPRDFVIEKKEWEFLSLRDMLAYVRAHPRMNGKDRVSHLYDIHARLAMPWACIVITLFAIPAGVATGRQSVFRGVLIAFGLFFGFYAMTIGCTLLAKREWIAPGLAAWLPNLSFLGAGLGLFARLR